MRNLQKLKDKNRRYHLKREYGISEIAYELLLLEQNGCCEICGTDKPKNYGGRFAIDHDHINKNIRGLLCLRCNLKLSVLENWDWRKKAEDYLNSYNRRNNNALRQRTIR